MRFGRVQRRAWRAPPPRYADNAEDAPALPAVLTPAFAVGAVLGQGTGVTVIMHVWRRAPVVRAGAKWTKALVGENACQRERMRRRGRGGSDERRKETHPRK